MIGGYYDLSNSSVREAMLKMMKEQAVWIPSMYPPSMNAQFTTASDSTSAPLDLTKYKTDGVSWPQATSGSRLVGKSPLTPHPSINHLTVASYLSRMIGCNVSGLHIISTEIDFARDNIVVECAVNPDINMWKYIRDNSSMYEHVDLTMERGGMSTLKATIPVSTFYNNVEGTFVDEPVYVGLTDEEEMRESLNDDNERSNREWALRQHEELSK